MDHHGSVRRLWEVFAFANEAKKVSNWTLITFTAIGAVAGGASTFILPWFPNSCREKGLDRFRIGLIFVVFDLVILATRWPFIKIAKARGHRWMFFLGYLIQAGALFLLGWINHFSDDAGLGFFFTALIFRAVQGLGASMVSAASLQVMNTLAYCNVGMISKLTEALVGLFRVLGALIGGGFFYAFGSGDTGFKIAFWILCGIMAMMSVTAPAMKLPVDPRTVPIREREPGEQTPFREMLSFPPVVALLVIIFTVDFCSTALEPVLSIHLYELDQMDAWMRGLAFAEMGLFGAIFTPLSSWLAECGRGILHRKMFVLIGIYMTGLAIVGLGVAASGGIANAFMILLGIGSAMMAVPAMPAMLWDLPDDSNLTDGEIARVINHVAAVAAVLGPLWGGGLSEAAGFKIMTGITGGCIAIVGVIISVGIGCFKYKWRNPPKFDEDGDEIHPLLDKQSELKKEKAGEEQPPEFMTAPGQWFNSWFSSGDEKAPAAEEASAAKEAPPTSTVVEPVPVATPQPEPQPQSEPEKSTEPDPENPQPEPEEAPKKKKRGFFGRMFGGGDKKEKEGGGG